MLCKLLIIGQFSKAYTQFLTVNYEYFCIFHWLFLDLSLSSLKNFLLTICMHLWKKNNYFLFFFIFISSQLCILPFGDCRCHPSNCHFLTIWLYDLAQFLIHSFPLDRDFLWTSVYCPNCSIVSVSSKAHNFFSWFIHLSILESWLSNTLLKTFLCLEFLLFRCIVHRVIFIASCKLQVTISASIFFFHFVIVSLSALHGISLRKASWNTTHFFVIDVWRGALVQR